MNSLKNYSENPAAWRLSQNIGTTKMPRYGQRVLTGKSNLITTTNSSKSSSILPAKVTIPNFRTTYFTSATAVRFKVQQPTLWHGFLDLPLIQTSDL
ncbi:MAG: hypothetical protein U0T75_03210 [Chitinophagales bacterium]